jgi:hypothetical protein
MWIGAHVKIEAIFTFSIVQMPAPSAALILSFPLPSQHRQEVQRPHLESKSFRATHNLEFLSCEESKPILTTSSPFNKWKKKEQILVCKI